MEPVLEALEAGGILVRGEIRPGGAELAAELEARGYDWIAGEIAGAKS